MIRPSHQALRSRGVGYVSAAIPLKPQLQRTQNLETRHERRNRPAEIDGLTVPDEKRREDRSIDCPRPEQQSP